MKVKLGNKVRDIVTLHEGIAISRSDLLSGTVQFAVQPAGDGKDIPNAWNIDEQTLEVVEVGISDRTIPATPQKIKLGQEVEDTVTGLTGIATERSTFMNGCVRYAVQPPVDKDGKMPEAIYFDSKRLEVVGDGVAETAKKKRSATGGPSRSTRSMRFA